MAQEWTFVGLQHINVLSQDGDYTVNVPSGVQDGDRLVLCAIAKDDAVYPTIGEPTVGTWNTRHNDSAVLNTLYWRFRFWDKVAASEPSSYTVNIQVPGPPTPSGGILLLLAIRNIAGFDESNYDGETGTNHTGPALTINNDDSAMLQFSINATYDSGHSDGTGAWIGVTGDLALDHEGMVGLGLAHLNVAAGSRQLRIDSDSSIECRNYALAYKGLVIGEATLQGVATVAPEASLRAAGEATLQGVGSVTPEGFYRAGGSATLQGVAALSAEAHGVFALDFSRYDAYIEDSLGGLGVIYFEGEGARKQTITRTLQTQKMDTGSNPNEIRPESGYFFAQGDFSHGSGQRYFHHIEADPKAYFRSEGFDVFSEPGKLKHQHATTLDLSDTSAGVLEQANGLLFVTSGTTIKRSDGNFPGSWTADDPHLAEGAVTVNDLCSSGAVLYAALGVNGIHKRDAAGTWTHWSACAAIRVAFVKNRVIGATATDIYDIASDGTPGTALETLPSGWSFEDIFEAGAFVYALCVNTNDAKSELHIYGWNSGATAIEKKGQQELPSGQLFKSGWGHLNIVLLGAGKKNTSGGYDPILYRAVPDDNGFLEYAKVAVDIGSSSTDLTPRGFCALGEQIVCGWSTGSGSYMGAARAGLGAYDIGVGAFSHHLRGAATAAATRSVLAFKGRLIFSVPGTGVYAEDPSKYVADATLITSVGDWNNAGDKVWDFIEVNHASLPTGTSVKVYYATEVPTASTTWKEALTSLVVGSDGESVRTSNLHARLFALKIISYANAAQTSAPEPVGYSVRSNPAPDEPEYILSRFIRIGDKDRKDQQAEEINQDAENIRQRLLGLAFQWVKVYEPGGLIWLARVESITDSPPFLTQFQHEDFYVVQLVLSGTLD